ncbi:MAG: efflux transporter periplasmic adaptor subunit, partial [Psychrobacter sp.]
LFRIDMTAQIYIVIDQAEDAVLVPSAAVKERPARQQADGETTTNTFVRVLKDDETVEDRTVEVGIDNRVNAQILSGLQEGEQVILSEGNAGTSGGGGARMPGSGPPR